MKLLSFCVPCYNSQDYMENCVNSLLPGGEDVEIIIVDDGSKDNTALIGDALSDKYPGIVRCVHQENGGHGEAVNTGIREATGKYFKVVDSDDWVDEAAYKKVLSTLKEIESKALNLDMMVCNFVYEKEGAKHKKVMQYLSALPVGKMFTWDDVKRFKTGQYLLMHSVIYRSELLKECGMILPKHTFYVDNLYVFQPLPYVNNIYYLDVDFYRYYIGREDQSVNEKVMIGRIDQQLKVNYIMIDYLTSAKINHPKVYAYMRNYLDIIMCVSSILLIREGTVKSLKKKTALWKYLESKDGRLYKSIRYGLLGITMNLHGDVGRKISVAAYKMAQKVVGFN